MPRHLLLAAVTIAALLVSVPAARADWVWPVQGEVITPYRNGDDPYAAGQHRGIDIAAPTGTPVVAAAGGQVRFAGTAGSSGLTVSIRTADGLFDTSYLHLSSIAVHKGVRVAAGDQVGAVGMTGKRSAAAPHLHFGVRDAGTDHGYHDPLAFLPPPPVPAERPRPAPAPGPQPVPHFPLSGPAPAPVARPNARRPIPRQAPRAHPHRIPLPAPRGAPAPRDAPAPGGAPAPRHASHPEPASRRSPAPHRTPAPLAAPEHAPHLHPAPHGAPREAPALERPRGPAPAGQRTAAAGPRANPAEPSTPGPDLGYALACVGLLLAAAVLGLSEDGRQATRRSGARLAGVLRPLLGRR
jgi:Peptidase family M23